MVTAGYVLAGGRSTRMGVDKARVPFVRGEPMAVTVAKVLATGCDPVHLVRRVGPDALPWPGGIEVIFDEAPTGDAHPLWGVAAALEHATSDWVLMAPCDLPGLTPEAVQSLLRHSKSLGDPVVACCSERRHPLLAVIPKDWRHRASKMAEQGASVRAFTDDCATVSLPDVVLRNLNRWADAQRAGPIRALLDTLPALSTQAEKVVVAGEQVRLAQRGCIDPEHGPPRSG